MSVKFHEKNKAVYFGLQSASGSANKVAIASLGATTAIACTSVAADPTRETGSFSFLGDSLSRDEYTYEKDKYVKLDIETFQQRLTTLGAAITPDTNSIWKLFQCCGGFVAVGGDNSVSVGNNRESPDYGSANVRLASPDDATNDKLYSFWDLRGTVDVQLSIGEAPTLKFSLMGNADDPAANAKQVADFGFQTTRVAFPVLPDKVLKSEITLLDDVFTNALGTVSTVTYTAEGKVVVTTSAAHGITSATTAIQVSGASPAAINGTFMAYVTSATTVTYFVKGITTSSTATGTIVVKKGDTAPKPFCYNTLSAPNFFGFDMQRFVTSCEQGTTKGAVPTDVSVTMLEDQVGGTAFNPDANVTKFFGVYLKVGDGTAGNNVTYMWDKLQLANVKEGKVATYQGRDVSFRNTGQSYILYN